MYTKCVCVCVCMRTVRQTERGIKLKIICNQFACLVHLHFRMVFDGADAVGDGIPISLIASN